jgi:hopene-associated glycosyltransferase HpnB
MKYDIIAAAVLASWCYLITARGAFWWAGVRDDGRAPLQTSWPAVVAVVPARDEAGCVADSIGSLLDQDYPGAFSVILVDDQSGDGTAGIALRAAKMRGASDRLTIVFGQGPPAGWMGKTWAQQQGVDVALRQSSPPSYVLLTDADIVHAPDTLTWLVAQAQSKGSVLTSLMAKLHCTSFAEQLLIPAFIFFFQMLYPFPWANKPGSATAAAAGGCMLVRSDALKAAGGIDAIRNALIDDCSLAKLMKAQGQIWLGLTERVHSSRPYPDFDDIRCMVSRSAYAQLRYSPLLLAGTVVGMALTYLAPPLLALFASGPARWLGLLAWGLMALSFVPTLRLYGRSLLWGPALPAIALCYMLFTLDSALQFARGKGGLWKGRVQALEP